MPGRARPPCTYDEIDSEAFPASERLARWRETGRLPMTAEPTDADSRRRFHIRYRRLSGASGRFTDLIATPIKLTRAKSHCARDGLDMVSLTLMLGLRVRHQFGTGGRSTITQPGRILVKDFAQPATAWWQTSSRSINLHLPRLTVEAAVGDKVKHLHGTVLSSEGLSPMLEAQLLKLAYLAPRLQGTVRTAALDATVELAASVLRGELGLRIEDEVNNPGLFAAAQMLIRRQLTSHHLSPEVIARQLHCSRAHLYRVFAAQGETVANYVRELRLRHARDLLADGSESNSQVGAIAYRCGFEDPVHFTRLFRQRFGLTPRELRSSSTRSER